MHKTRYIPALAFALIAFASLAAGIAGCESTNCHEDEECASGGGHGAGGNSSDAGAD